MRYRLARWLRPAKHRAVLALIVLIAALGYCTRDYFRPYAKAPATIVQDATIFPAGHYDDVAWLGDTLLAFLYVPMEVVETTDFVGLWERRIILYELGTRQWRELLLQQPDECYSAWASTLERLPNGNLGFLYECNSDDRTSNAITLYTWNVLSGEVEALQRYPSIAAARYSFSPDMTELIQEDAVGAGLNNRLFWVTPDGTLEQVFPDWRRVSTPSWSPDGTRIAFVATKSYPGDVFGPFKTFGQIAGLALSPWDIYLMEADGSNPHIVLPKVHAGTPQWLPSGKLLTFPGEYGRTRGIWVLNPETRAVTQIWPRSEIYELSPDGTRAVVLEQFALGSRDQRLFRPIIVTLPASLLSAPAAK